MILGGQSLVRERNARVSGETVGAPHAIRRFYSSRMASTGFMASARSAGATPATVPSAESVSAEPMAMEKEMRKLPGASEGKFDPMPESAAARIKTAKTMPVRPARRVRTALSVRI